MDVDGLNIKVAYISKSFLCLRPRWLLLLVSPTRFFFFFFCLMQTNVGRTTSCTGGICFFSRN